MAEARNLKSREYFTDIFNSKSAAPTHHVDPRPAKTPLFQNKAASTTVRASYQDSNIFGYKGQQNQTWQEPGRVDRNRTELKTGYYNNAHHGGNTLHNPHSPMKHNKSQTHLTHTIPNAKLYNYRTESAKSMERKGKEFNGSHKYDKAAGKRDLLSASQTFIRDVDHVDNRDHGETSHMKKQVSFHTKWTDQPHAHETSPTRNRMHQIPTNANWSDSNHNQIKGNPRGYEDSKNSFNKRSDQLSSQVLPATDYKVILLTLGLRTSE